MIYVIHFSSFHLLFIQSEGIDFEVVRYGQGMEAMIFASLDNAAREQHWLIIEDLHLAPERFCFDLSLSLINVHHMIGMIMGMGVGYF